jgi:hypothetical protein
MRRSCIAISGMLLALVMSGCGETQEEGPIQYKGSDSPAIQQLRDGMSANVKNKSIISKGEEKPAPKKEKDADKKPAGDATPEKKK